jgi:hypothetical protein
MKAIKSKIAGFAIAVIAVVILAQAGSLIQTYCGGSVPASLSGVAACYQFCPQQ